MKMKRSLEAAMRYSKVEWLLTETNQPYNLSLTKLRVT